MKQCFLSKEVDSLDIMQGEIESQDWVDMLRRMYLKCLIIKI